MSVPDFESDSGCMSDKATKEYKVVRLRKLQFIGQTFSFYISFSSHYELKVWFIYEYIIIIMHLYTVLTVSVNKVLSIKFFYCMISKIYISQIGPPNCLQTYVKSQEVSKFSSFDYLLNQQ